MTKTSGTVVIVSPQIPYAYRNGGIGTFVFHFVRLLRMRGTPVEIIFTEPAQVPASAWKPFFAAQGVIVHELVTASQSIPFGFPRHQYISSLVDARLDTINDVAAVYFADWRANGIVPLRQRRTSRRARPPMVTVLHGNSTWHRENMDWWPADIAECELEAAEQYCIGESEYLVSPSAYGAEWIVRRGWKVKARQIDILPYPFIPSEDRPQPTDSADRTCRELVYFGRLETRKGIEIFVDAVRLLGQQRGLRDVERIVLLGNAGSNTIGSPAAIATELTKVTGLPVVLRDGLDMAEALDDLAGRAASALVVIPSRAETLGFVAIEASLIPGLHVLCANATALPEVFAGRGADQLFTLSAAGLAEKVAEVLERGLAQPSELISYDWEAANRRWLAFHDRMVDKPATDAIIPAPAAEPRGAALVDICVPNYNLSRFLGQLLASLEGQTDQRFRLHVLDDGSNDPGSRAEFERLASRYKREGWQFAAQANTGVCVARNRLATMGSLPYILWMDADNVAAPHMVARFLEGIETSGADLLSCHSFHFVGDDSPYLRSAGGPTQPASQYYIPAGNFPALGILDNPFGDLNVIMRRKAFEASDKFTETYPNSINHEDRALFTQLGLMRFDLDVVPEVLYFYRVRADSRLRSTPQFQNDKRVIDVYRRYLAPLGLSDLPEYFIGAHYSKYSIASDGGIPTSELVRLARAKDMVRALLVKIRRRLPI